MVGARAMDSRELSTESSSTDHRHEAEVAGCRLSDVVAVPSTPASGAVAGSRAAADIDPSSAAVSAELVQTRSQIEALARELSRATAGPQCAASEEELLTMQLAQLGMGIHQIRPDGDCLCVALVADGAPAPATVRLGVRRDCEAFLPHSRLN